MPPKKPKTAKAKTVLTDLSEGGGGATFSSSRVERYYSRIVVGFVIVTLALVGLIAYFSFSKTVLTIQAKPVSQEFTVRAELAELDGVVVLTDVEGSAVSENLSATSTKTGKATGTVQLVNTYTSDQPLVETTRLMSSEGILFRTTETVTVPAGGSVEVGVVADQEGATGDIPPSRFDVVALWDGLKDNIYGTSSAPMSGGVQQVGSVTAKEITEARQNLTTELENKAKAVFVEEVPNYEGMPEQTRILEAYVTTATQIDEVSAQPGEEAESITATQKLTVAAPVVNADRLVEVLQNRLVEQLPEGFEFVGDVTLENVAFTMQDLADDYSSATIVMTVTTETVLTVNNELLERSKLTNKTESEITDYLTAFDEVQSIDLDFSPFWVMRTPSVAEHITVLVQ